MFGFYVIMRYEMRPVLAFMYTTCTKLASQKRLGILLAI